jgi:glycosyltransferase involved in cell wall biosynthesis
MGIEFIIPTYNRTNHLITIIGSILSQTNQNWKIHIVGDNIPQKNLDLLKSFLNVINDDRIKFTNLPVRYNDWGHTPRNYGLKEATEEWVVMTGEDNYYVPHFVDGMLNMINDDTYFVFCNMVHNWVNNDYVPIKSELIYGQVDMGNFMTRTKFAQQLELDTTKNEADWKFIQEYLTKFSDGTINKVEKVLYVHN